MSRRHELLQLRAGNSQREVKQTQHESVASTGDNLQGVHSPSKNDSRWTNWLDRLPRAPRIPLPRTDMGGSDIAVVEATTTSAAADRR